MLFLGTFHVPTTHMQDVNHMKVMKCFRGVALAAALVSVAGPAAAAQRNVIAEAAGICGAGSSWSTAACDLVSRTNGGQDLASTGCVAVYDLIDNGVLDYRLKNCDQNEESLLRSSSSAVLSLRDVFVRKKTGEKKTAAAYFCYYASTYNTLKGVGKLADGGADLAADAQSMARDLGYSCL